MFIGFVEVHILKGDSGSPWMLPLPLLDGYKLVNVVLDKLRSVRL